VPQCPIAGDANASEVLALILSSYIVTRQTRFYTSRDNDVCVGRCLDHVQPHERQPAGSDRSVWRHGAAGYVSLSEEQGQRQVPARTHVVSVRRKPVSAQYQAQLYPGTVQPMGKQVCATVEPLFEHHCHRLI